MRRSTTSPVATVGDRDDALMAKRPAPSAFDLLSIGGMAAACVGLGVGGGYWLGSAVGSESVATFSGLAVGLCAAVAVAYLKIKSFL